MKNVSMPLQALFIAAAALAAISTSACTSADDSTVGLRKETAEVGPSGGRVTLAGVEVDVPADAVGRATSISVTRDESKPEGYTVDGAVYRFEPSGLVFSKPVTISLPTSAPDRVVFWTLAGSEELFEPLVTTIEGGRAIAHPSHFSRGFVGVDPKKPTESCQGARDEACGNCGTRTRTCENGVWSSWSACAGEGVCTPNATEACGTGGTRTCASICAWGGCTDQTCDGPTAQACGNCGSQSRSCVNGTWSDWSACSGSGVCAPNTTQACGPGGTQSCNASCQWDACSVPVCDGPATQACGNCGTMTRTCNGGVWSSWSACTDEGVCRPYDVQACGAGGSQACTTSCQWETCQAGITCTNVERNWNTTTNSCDYLVPTYGVPTAVEHGVKLTMASYDNDYEGAVNTTSAGINHVNHGLTPVFFNRDASHTTYTSDFSGGSLTRDKSTGIVEVTVDAGRLFSLSGGPYPACPRRIEVKCRGADVFAGCAGPSSQSCGNCGTQTRRCTESGWDNIGWSACTGQGVCSPGATQTCGGGGTSSCTASCQWVGCCTQPTDPASTTLAAATRPLNVVVDGCNVYWTDQSGGLRVVPTNGGAATVVSAGGPLPTGAVQMRTDALVKDGTNLYWTDRVSSASAGYSQLLGQGAVWQTTLVGNTSTKIWTGPSTPGALGVVGSNVFIGRMSDILRVPVGGGAESQVCAVGTGALATTSTDVFLGKSNELSMVPISGGTPAAFGPAAGSVNVVVTDGTNVYWGDFDGSSNVGHVYAKPLPGGAQRTLASGAIQPLGIAFDAAYLYVTTGKAGTVLKIAIADGTTTTLASGQGWPYGIAVDPQFVYWANNNGGTNGIMRVGK